MQTINTAKAAPALTGSDLRNDERLGSGLTNEFNALGCKPQARLKAPADAPEPNRDVRDGRRLLGHLGIRRREVFAWNPRGIYVGVFGSPADAIAALKAVQL